MLKTNKTTTLTGSSEVGGQQIVYMTASIGANGGNATVNKTVTNQELYVDNKTECRKDIADFETAVYAIEDGGAS